MHQGGYFQGTLDRRRGGYFQGTDGIRSTGCRHPAAQPPSVVLTVVLYRRALVLRTALKGLKTSPRPRFTASRGVAAV